MSTPTVAQLFDSHAPDLYRYLARRAGHDVAEDVLGRTFVTVCERLGSYDPGRGEVRGWLFGIASNHLRHHFREELRRWRAYARYPLSVVEDPSDAATARAHASIEQRRVGAAVADLDEGDRDVLLLFAWADLSYAEIAEALGIPVGTVRSRLHRARRTLRGALTPEMEKEAR